MMPEEEVGDPRQYIVVPCANLEETGVEFEKQDVKHLHQELRDAWRAARSEGRAPEDAVADVLKHYLLVLEREKEAHTQIHFKTLWRDVYKLSQMAHRLPDGERSECQEAIRDLQGILRLVINSYYLGGFPMSVFHRLKAPPELCRSVDHMLLQVLKIEAPRAPSNTPQRNSLIRHMVRIISSGRLTQTKAVDLVAKALHQVGYGISETWEKTAEYIRNQIIPEQRTKRRPKARELKR
jgi:hypothetical protein